MEKTERCASVQKSKGRLKSKSKTDLKMKTTYFLLVLGLLYAVAYSLPIEEDEPLEDELLEGNQI